MNSKSWHLFFAIISALGLVISILLFIEAIIKADKFDIFKSCIQILLFTIWLVESWKAYRKIIAGKTN